MCLRRTVTGSNVVVKSAAPETGTIPSGVTASTEGGKAPTAAGVATPLAGMMAEPGASPGRSAVGFDLAVEFEGSFLRKNPSEIETPHLTCLTRTPRRQSAPLGVFVTSAAQPGKEFFLWLVPRPGSIRPWHFYPFTGGDRHQTQRPDP